MIELLWRLAALIISRPAVAARLIRRAQRTPYTHIMSADGADCYMGRWWLFNAYTKDANGDPAPARWSWLPSIRVHHIMRPDQDRHLHDHPWNARTIVLRGWYEEERHAREHPYDGHAFWRLMPIPAAEALRVVFMRRRGYTGRLLFGQFHRISAVPEAGVWTLFFTWRKRGTWGFDVNGVKVPWRKYLGVGE